MSQYIIAKFKRGDQTAPVGKEYLAGKDGFLVSYRIIDDTVDIQPSEFNRKVFTHIKFPLSAEATLKAYGQKTHPLKYDKDDKVIPYTEQEKIDFRCSKGLINYPSLGALISRPTLDTEVHSKDEIEIIDCTAYVPTDIIKSSATLNPSALDVNLVTSGSYSVKSGGDYEDFAEVMADIGTPMTGNLTFEVQGTFTDTTEPVRIVTDIDGYTLKITCDNNPYADPTDTARLVTYQQGGSEYIYMNSEPTSSGSKFIAEKLYFLIDTTGGTTNVFYEGAETSNLVIQIHDIMIDGDGESAYGIRTQEIPDYIELWNCLFWDSTNEGLYIFRSMSSNCVVENMTFFNQPGVIAINDATLKNLRFIQGTSSGLDTTDLINCLTTEATFATTTQSETNCVKNATEANEVVSSSSASSDFMRVKTGGDCEDGGTTPDASENTTGQRGNPRPHGSDYTIGHDEAVSVSTQDRHSVMSGVTKGVMRGVM